MEEPENTAHLIDVEPVLFLGCNNREILGLAGLGFVAGLAIGLTLAILTGIGLLVLPPLIILPVLFIYQGGKRLGKAKEGKPSGYYDRLLAAQLNQYGIGKAYINRAGYWRVRR
ncbi:MAG: DUF3487 family protein [Pseudomonadota bacterium]